MDLLQRAVSGRKGGTKTKWVLEQILLMLKMREENYTTEQIAEVVGHPKNSVTYKFRWCSEFKSIQELYENFGQKFIDEAEMKTRIENYLNSQTETEETSEVEVAS